MLSEVLINVLVASIAASLGEVGQVRENMCVCIVGMDHLEDRLQRRFH